MNLQNGLLREPKYTKGFQLHSKRTDVGTGSSVGDHWLSLPRGGHGLSDAQPQGLPQRRGDSIANLNQNI